MSNEPSRTIACVHVIGSQRALAGAQAITISGDSIASIEPTSAPATDRLLAMPALVNAHDHGRAIRTSSIGADAKPLESWLHYLALFPSVDPYLAAAMTFANSALGGAGTVMVHYTRAQGFTDLPTEVAEVARAARDVGIRAGFAVSMKDRNPLVYGDSEALLSGLPAQARAEIERRFMRKPLSPSEYMALVDDVAAAADGPGFNVQYGPNGVQWCSDELLQATAEASHRTGRRVHMHLLETKYQRQWADTTYPGGVVRMLDDIGLLSPRLTLAHCVWATPEELELLAERGVTIAVNTSSNLHLHSGIAPVTTMKERGCLVALGIDSKAFDDDDDALRELRLSYLLHAGTGFDRVITRQEAVHTAVSNGRFAVTNVGDGGLIAAGSAADMLLLDWAALDNDDLREDIEPINILFSRATARQIRELIVAGRTIVRDGHVSGIDLPAIRNEVLSQMRSGIAKNATLVAALSALDQAIARHYLPDSSCF
ncbi:MAG: putative cytosine deaminase [Bradyrhizobium sp.]|nr:putative cytosine deaminase [Bradyrhizobium sp.]